jgi:hypothetical protein
VTVRIRPFSNSELKVAGGLTDVWGVDEEGYKIGYTDDYLVNARRVPVEYIYGKDSFFLHFAFAFAFGGIG